MFAGASLTVRLSFTILGIVILSVLLSGALNYFKFERVVLASERSRYAFVVDDLRATIEDSMNIGLQLSALRNTLPMIQRRKAQDDAIGTITVFSDGGVRLFDTDRRSGGQVPQVWLNAALAGRPWTDETSQEFIAGAPIVNNFGQVVGGVALTYSQNNRRRAQEAVLIALSQVILQVAVVTGLLVVPAVWLVMYGTRRRLSAIAASLDSALTDGPAQTAAKPDGQPDRIDRAVHKALAAIRSSERAIEELEAGS